MNVVATIKYTPSGYGYYLEHGTEKEYFDSYEKVKKVGDNLLKNNFVVQVINQVNPKDSLPQ